ncbi:hypothetical protein [Amycolatopsis palatopharyngis]|uniref:hypothetical protein n=1 Tax=Amycolatopsis palatopharyngis TaxID=187982 RepID=UPI001FE5A230|nr:hypothetical protein [Amycolatopsis palatopharyngis]
MRWKEILVVGSVVLLAGTACASQEPDPVNGTRPADGEQPISAPSTTVPPLPMPSAEEPMPAPQPPNAPGEPVQVPDGAEQDDLLPGKQIDGSALPEAYPQDVATSADGRKLLIVAQEGGCGQVSAELAEQSARQVVVNLVETEPAEKVACTMDIRFETVSVVLDEPLGERTVVLTYENRKG